MRRFQILRIEKIIIIEFPLQKIIIDIIDNFDVCEVFTIISTKTTVKLTDGVLNQGRTEQSGSHVEARVEKNKTKNQFIQ